MTRRAAADAVLPGRWAVSGHAFAGWEPQMLVEQLAAWGIGRLDYWPWNAGELGLDRFTTLAGNSGLRIECINVPSALGRFLVAGQEATIALAVIEAIDQAQEVGAPFVQAYVGAPTAGTPSEAAERLAGDLRALVSAAERKSIVVLVENNLDQRGEDINSVNPSRSADSLAGVARMVDSPALRLTYDPCNFLAVGEPPFTGSYEKLKPFLANVHVKDCVRYPSLPGAASDSDLKLLVDSHGGPHLPKPVGQGAVPWTDILARLRADGYGGLYTLDPFVSDTKLRDWCEESLSWLRSPSARSRPIRRAGT